MVSCQIKLIIIQRNCYNNLPISVFEADFIENQPQNPEFRINPENYHPGSFKIFPVIHKNGDLLSQLFLMGESSKFPKS